MKKALNQDPNNHRHWTALGIIAASSGILPIHSLFELINVSASICYSCTKSRCSNMLSSNFASGNLFSFNIMVPESYCKKMLFTMMFLFSELDHSALAQHCFIKSTQLEQNVRIYPKLPMAMHKYQQTIHCCHSYILIQCLSGGCFLSVSHFDDVHCHLIAFHIL